MKIDILSAIPEYYDVLNLSLIGKAIDSGIIEIKVHNLHDFGKGVHKAIDDTPYGGGAGMVLRADILKPAIDSLLQPKSCILITSASGHLFKQADAKKLSEFEHLIFVCPRFEGIDQRIVQYYEAQNVRIREFCIGDFVALGGESISIPMIESIVRLIPGVLGNNESIDSESFASPNQIEHPQYTRPEIFEGIQVPPTLLSGNHKEIAAFRASESKLRSEANRPDLTP